MVINLVLFWFMLLFAGFLALWTTAIVRCRHVARHHHRPEDKTQEHTALHFKKLHFVTFQAGQNTLRKIYFTLDWRWKSIIAPSWSRKPHDLLVGSFIFASSQNWAFLTRQTFKWSKFSKICLSLYVSSEQLLDLRLIHTGCIWEPSSQWIGAWCDEVRWPGYFLIWSLIGGSQRVPEISDQTQDRSDHPPRLSRRRGWA